MYKISKLLVFALIISLLTACEFSFKPNLTTALVNGKWTLSHLRLSDAPNHEIEAKSKQEFDKEKYSCEFNGDGTYRSTGKMEFNGYAWVEEQNGSWSVDPGNTFFYFDTDTFQIITVSDTLIELQMSQSSSDKVLLNEYPEDLGSKVIVVFTSPQEVINNTPSDNSGFRISKIEAFAFNEKIGEEIYSYSSGKIQSIEYYDVNAELDLTRSNYYSYDGEIITNTYYGKKAISVTEYEMVEYTRYYQTDNNKRVEVRSANYVTRYSYDNNLLVKVENLDSDLKMDRYQEYIYSDTKNLNRINYFDAFSNPEKYYTVYEYDVNKVIGKSYNEQGSNSHQTIYEFINGKRSAFYGYYMSGGGQWMRSPANENTLYEYNNDGLLYIQQQENGEAKRIYHYEEKKGNEEFLKNPEYELFWIYE
jgi:hypothetical protein